MRIVKRAEFLQMPAGTVYTTYEPCNFGDLMIKGETLHTDNNGDFCEQSIVGAIDSTGSDDWTNKLFRSQETGESLAMDFDCQGRDGLFDSMDSLYAVWERADVEALIARLQATLTG